MTYCRSKHQGRQPCVMEANAVLPPWPAHRHVKADRFPSDLISGPFLELSDSRGAVRTVTCRWRCYTKNSDRRGSLQLGPAEAQLCESCFKFLWLVITQQFPSWAPCLPVFLTRYKPGRRARPPLPPPYSPFLYSGL